MTRLPPQSRAVALATLVVLSVVAGSITFAGSTAAVSGVAEESAFDPSSVPEDTSDTFSFNYSIDDVNTSDTVTVNLTIPSGFTIEGENAELVNASGNVIDDSPSENGNDLVFTGSSSTATVYLRGDVTLGAPSVNADQTYNPTITASDNDGQASATGSIEVTNDALAIGTVTQLSPRQIEEETTNQHTFNYTFTGVDTSGDTTFSLSVPGEFTIDEENVVLRDASGSVVNNSAELTDGKVEFVDNAGTETVYLSGTVNVTAPAVPEGQEELKGSVKINVSDTQGRSDSASETLTVTFTGGQAGSPEFLSAIQYTQSDDTPAIEVSFSEDVQNFGSNYGLYVDEEEVTSDIVDSVSEAQGRAIIELDETDSRDLTLRLEDGIVDSDGNAVTNLRDPEYKSVRFAPTSVRAGGDANVYSGSIVSIVAASSNTDVTIEGVEDDTDNYFFEGSTGTNSRIFLFDTEGEEIGDYEADIGSEGTASLTVRNLDVTLDVDDRNVTNLDSIEGTVSAQVGGRQIRLELLDDDGDPIDGVSDRFVTLSGQGSYDFSYDIEQLALETGDYIVRATDTTSGITVESDTITVREAGDTEATFTRSTVREARGDVVAIPIELANTREGTVTIGSDNVGYEANVTVRDAGGDDRDGRVTIYFNTYAASTYGTDSFSDENDLIQVSEDDEVVSGEVSLDVSNLLDAEIYPVEASVDGRLTDVSQVELRPRETVAIRTWTAPRNRYGNLDAPEDVVEGTDEEWVTRDSEVAFGDAVVYEIQATGLEGALDARGEDTVTAEFFDFANGSEASPAAQFTVEQRDPGPNRDPLVLQLNESNSRVIADSENDTYYVVTRTGEFGPAGVRDEDNDGAIDPGETDYGEIDAEDDLRAAFTVFGDDENDLDLTEDGEDEVVETDLSLTEAELTMNEPFNVTAASGQEVFGEATVAPGTELTVRVRSGEDVRPAFLKTATTTVDTDGQFLVTLSFNDTEPGDEYTITVTDTGPASELEVEGTVEAVIPTATTDTPEETTVVTTTDTATPTDTTATLTDEPTTTEIPTVQTPTTTPGFGVVTALIALAGAALLAFRRERERR